MTQAIISQMISLAKTSTMTSKHAAAIVNGKTVLSMGTNYSLPAGELVDIATATKASKGCVRRDDEHPTQRQQGRPFSSYRFQKVRPTTSFDSLYQRYQGFERGSMRTQEDAERLYRLRLIQRVRCEKRDTFEEADSTHWVSACPTCRGECFGEVSF